MNSKYISFLFILILGSLVYFSYQYFFGANISIQTNYPDAQVLVRKINEKEKQIPIKKLNEFFSKKYRKLGRTPLETRLTEGFYILQIKKSGHVPLLQKIHVAGKKQALKLSLMAGYRYVYKGDYFYQNKKRRVNGFFLSEAEVTNREYIDFCLESGHQLPYYANDSRFSKPDQPVMGINYDDAIAYTKWLSETSGYNCRLPYEIEWQFAASHGDTARVYPWGNAERTTKQYLANYHPFNFLKSRLDPIDIDGFHYPAPVKSFPRSDDRFYDLGGNVFEWCLDTLRSKKEFPNYNLDESLLPYARVVKGGSWNFNQLLMRIKSQVFVDGRIRRGNTGIRVLIEF